MDFKRINVVAFLTAILVASNAIADNAKTMVLEGVALTGFNRLFGEPVWDLALVGPSGFNSVAAFNPNGDQPLPLTPDSPGSTLLGTVLDPVFLELPGVPADGFDPADVNLPLRSVRINTDFTGEGRMTLRSHLEAEQLEPSLAVPNDPITLDTWLKARGKGRIRCNKEGNATVELKMRGLIPFGVYTVWGFVPNTQGTALSTFPPIPVGGVPNVLVVNKQGDANFRRELNFCPMDPKVGELPLLAIALALHTDHQVYAHVPALFERRIMPGLQVHAHVGFLVTGEPLR